jgi:hypothetical protein
MNQSNQFGKMLFDCFVLCVEMSSLNPVNVHVHAHAVKTLTPLDVKPSFRLATPILMMIHAPERLTFRLFPNQAA